jgi:hypothetical protein
MLRRPRALRVADAPGPAPPPVQGRRRRITSYVAPQAPDLAGQQAQFVMTPAVHAPPVSHTVGPVQASQV